MLGRSPAAGNLCFRSSGRGDQPIYQYRDGTGQQYGASHGHGVADGSHTILVGADLKRFFVPLYVGHKGLACASTTKSIGKRWPKL